MTLKQVNCFWFRRDLRLDDNTALYHAFSDGLQILPVFIFDQNILEKLLDKDDARVSFIYSKLVEINNTLESNNASVLIKIGDPLKIWEEIISQYNVKNIYANDDYEPYAINRDQSVKKLLNKHNINFFSFKDHVIFHKNEILKSDGKPYSIFTPYSKNWLTNLTEKHVELKPNLSNENIFYKKKFRLPNIVEIGFKKTKKAFPREIIDLNILKQYKERRNFPAKYGTSLLGVHLRFGTISIRKLVKKAQEASFTFLNELIWRDFYQMILWNFPKVVTNNFKPNYNKVIWNNNKNEFESWCNGKTGYPIVDAGMRELNATGLMNNRVRMITASFLTKHLLIDWRWGEKYFAQKLLDYDLAANNGGWQWAAGTGTDAQPYFRVFNPQLQTEKFDPNLNYIKKWVPEFNQNNYPKPIVDHKYARERCINTFKKALSD